MQNLIQTHDLKWTRCAAIAATVVLMCGAASPAFAQGPGRGQLPFSNIYQRPAVSPYTMLGNTVNGNGQAVNQANAINPLIYQQLIQPQIQQQQQQVQQLRQNGQISRLQNQVQQIQRSTTSRQVSPTIRATGHASTYLNKSHFYPRK